VEQTSKMHSSTSASDQRNASHAIVILLAALPFISPDLRRVPGLLFRA
jgi:hypothetical protein